MGGANNYEYAPNPVGWVDPLGLTRNKEEADRQAKSITAAQIPKNPKFAGHGSINPGRMHEIPEGTSLTVYSVDGATISDPLGQAIERGEDLSGLYSKTYMPGDKVPELVLHPNCGKLNICATSVQVKRETKINELLKPNMGKCDWAACTHIPGNKNENIIHHTDGSYYMDPKSNKITHKYDGEWVKIGG